MNDKNIDHFIKLQEMLNKLGEVQRADYWPGASRQQNETALEHSFFLAILSWEVAHKLKLNLNHEKILKYALVHDLPEAYTGDLPLFSDPKQKALQNKKEQDAIKKIALTIPESEIPNAVSSYENQRDQESKFIHAMDSIVAVFVHITSRKTQFIDNHITKKHIEDILPKWRERTDISDEMRDFTNDLLDIWYKNVALYPDISNE